MSSALRVLSVVGTRPNFMKIAPIIAELRNRDCDFEHVLVHTGQHYDTVMSEVFLKQLGIDEPDHMLGVGAGTHAEQTSRVMQRLESVVLNVAPDVVLLPGDVNSTMAAALVTAKLGVRSGHIEAGLRSFDRNMPEEINRIVTDAVSDLLFTHSPEAEQNLMAEGRPENAIHYVGNTMIDTLEKLRSRIEASEAYKHFGLVPGNYLLVTLHRPALVDRQLLHRVLEELISVSHHLPVIFPVHPRTASALNGFDLGTRSTALMLVRPLGYLEFMSLMVNAGCVLTDSGGIQEETTYLGVPCFTLRDNTERPITVELGTNTLLGLAPHRVRQIPALLNTQRRDLSTKPPLWDGHAAVRIADVLGKQLQLSGQASSLVHSAPTF